MEILNETNIWYIKISTSFLQNKYLLNKEILNNYQIKWRKNGEKDGNGEETTAKGMKYKG